MTIYNYFLENNYQPFLSLLPIGSLLLFTKHLTLTSLYICSLSSFFLSRFGDISYDCVGMILIFLFSFLLTCFHFYNLYSFPSELSLLWCLPFFLPFFFLIEFMLCEICSLTNKLCFLGFKHVLLLGMRSKFSSVHIFNLLLWFIYNLLIYL